MRETKEKAKGITLIALVITIILLLLLAGITITQLAGSGLFEKAKLAKIYSREAEAEEKVNLEIMRIQVEKEGQATIEDVFNDFSSITNEEVDVTKVNRDSNNNIESIVVVVKGYEEFNFTIDINLKIIEICEIPKENWNGETLDDEIDNKEGEITELSINNNSDKLTENTTIIINSVSSAKLKKVEVILGEITVYSEQISGKKNYNKTLNISDLSNLEVLSFNQNYTIKVRMIALNGKIKEEDGNEILNYTIGNANSLKELSNQVNVSNNTFEGETILQIAEIDLSSVCSSSIGDWDPIGAAATPTTTWFNGTYNGNGKEIKNLYINNNADRTIGLFGFLGHKGIVKNVILYGEVTQNSNNSRAAGGIVGRNEGIMDNCINNANVINDYEGVGGVCGYNLNKITNCTNIGNVTGIEKVGGICSESAQNVHTLVSNNNSKVSSNNLIVSNCINNGTISGDKYIGGIYGYAYIGTIDSCTNTGSIIATTNIAGGIVGESNANITNCENTGNVTINGNSGE